MHPQRRHRRHDLPNRRKHSMSHRRHNITRHAANEAADRMTDSEEVRTLKHQKLQAT
jgi:cation transport regulator ChaB